MLLIGWIRNENFRGLVYESVERDAQTRAGLAGGCGGDAAGVCGAAGAGAADYREGGSRAADRRGVHEEDSRVHHGAPYLTSPLVDYLPASKTVPTPKAVLGDVAGAPGILPYAEEVYKYMRMLEKASPRVKVYSIGTTEEGREMIAVAVSSEAVAEGRAARAASAGHGWREMGGERKL